MSKGNRQTEYVSRAWEHGKKDDSDVGDIVMLVTL